MASVNFDNQSGLDLYWYFDGPGGKTGLVNNGDELPVTIPNDPVHCGWLIKTSFTGIVYVKAFDPDYALQIYAWTDSPIGNAPTGNSGTPVNWTNNSNPAGGPVTWIMKIPGTVSPYGGASLGSGGIKTSQPLPVNPKSGPPVGWNPRVRWGWRVANFTGRLLFTLDGFTLTADNNFS